MARVIQWKHGTTEEHSSFTGANKEISIDDDLHTARVHDGETPGGTALVLKAQLPIKLSQLTDDVGVWRADELTKLSQLENDAGFWKKTDLTKISQLENDSNFLTGHCSYCSYCTYCTQCANCYDCTTIQCTDVHCNAIRCKYYDFCSNCACNDDN